jgi:hypothetical protein
MLMTSTSPVLIADQMALKKDQVAGSKSSRPIAKAHFAWDWSVVMDAGAARWVQSAGVG